MRRTLFEQMAFEEDKAMRRTLFVSLQPLEKQRVKAVIHRPRCAVCGAPYVNCSHIFDQRNLNRTKTTEGYHFTRCGASSGRPRYQSDG